jgi:Mce-associated membrane protein
MNAALKGQTSTAHDPDMADFDMAETESAGTATPAGSPPQSDDTADSATQAADDVEPDHTADQPDPRSRLERGAAYLANLPANTADALRAWSPRKRITIVSALAVLAASLWGACVYLYLQTTTTDRINTAQASAVNSANDLVPKILSYKFDSVDADLANGLAGTTADFKNQFATLSTQLIAPAAKNQNIVTTATVNGTSVISATADKVDLLVFIDQTTTSKDAAPPRLDGSRVRVTMSLVDSKWLISNLTPV